MSEVDKIAQQIRDTWVRCDGRALRAVPPKVEPSKQWQKGFDAGVIALAVAIKDSGSHLKVHGSTVRTLADHHIDSAIDAAAQRFRAVLKTKRVKGGDGN